MLPGKVQEKKWRRKRSNRLLKRWASSHTIRECRNCKHVFILYIYIRIYNINILTSVIFSCNISEVKKKLEITNIIPDDSKRSEPIDNVWIARFHKWKIYSFEEAVQNHRETHHPTMYNLPTAPIEAFIELDMQVKKKRNICEIYDI